MRGGELGKEKTKEKRKKGEKRKRKGKKGKKEKRKKEKKLLCDHGSLSWFSSQGYRSGLH